MVSAFLYSLAAGVLGVVATGKPGEIAWKFLRLVGLLALVTACAAYVWPQVAEGVPNTPHNPWSVSVSVALVVAAIALTLIAPLAERVPGLFRAVGLIGASSGLAAACLVPVMQAGSGPPLRTIVMAVSQMLGAMLLGSITVAWLLGHAYLTAAKMTISPLRHFSRMLVWAVALRVAFLLLSLMLAWSLGGADLAGRLGDAWLILSLRVGLGLVGVGVFAYMVSDCVNLRATQSATGILYFGLLFAYIGELAHQYLIVQYGWAM